MRHAGTTDVPPNLAERYRRAITATADAQRVYNEAESVLRSAQRAELAALEAYRTHGATILVCA
jgi:DNA-binding transcriptional LysR family regulator